MTQPQLNNRHIRIFISSTFRDMQAERDYLIKYTFPELRSRCKERGLELTEVDLRWGVTREQAENGEVLSICLKEIDNSRPYFIGLLGERYGWIPPKQQIHQSVLEREKWIESHLQKSVTEMEILHGVLNNPEMTAKAFFYFRDPAFLNRFDGCALIDYKEEDPELQEKLNRLKQRIKESGYRVEENFRTPEELGGYILEDLWRSIDLDYPVDQIPDPLEKEIAEHERYASTRRRIYIGRQAYFDRLDAHVVGSDSFLVVKGASGSGKTALIANWVERYREKNPGVLIIQHYIGTSAKSSDYVHILSRIMKEFNRRFSLNMPVATNPQQLIEEFPDWLNMASAKGKVLIVLDGLNQLDAEVLELNWLPRFLPPNTRMIFSVVSGTIDNALAAKGWQEFFVDGLRVDERHLFIKDYLWAFTKRLEDSQMQLLVDAGQTLSPLFLKVLLDELRVFGVYEKLNDRINYYLKAKDSSDLFQLVLERLESDYEKGRPGLVKEALSFLYVSRYGLTEHELVSLLGDSDGLLPRMYWSPLYLALEEALVDRNGLLNFFHDYLRKAVFDRYIQSAEEENELHGKLAQYFDKAPVGQRKVDELPWHFMKARQWEPLMDMLTNLSYDFFSALWGEDGYNMKYYWSVLEQNSSFNPSLAYDFILDDPAEFKMYLWEIGLLFNSLGYKNEAFKLQQYLIDEYRSKGFQHYYPVLGNQANLLLESGRLDEAGRLFEEQEKISLAADDYLVYINSIIGRASVHFQKEEYEIAYRLFVEAADLSPKYGITGNSYDLKQNQAAVLIKLGRSNEAKELLQLCLEYYKRQGNRSKYVGCLNNLAVLIKRNQPGEALVYLKEAEHYYEEIKDVFNLIANLNNQAPALYALQEYDEALVVINRIKVLCEQSKNDKSLIQAYDVETSIFMEQGKLEEAMSELELQSVLCRKFNNLFDLQICLFKQGLIYGAMNDSEKAIKVLEEQGAVCLEINNLVWYEKNRDLLTDVYVNLENNDKVMELLDERFGLYNQYKLGNWDRLVEIQKQIEMNKMDEENSNPQNLNTIRALLSLDEQTVLTEEAIANKAMEFIQQQKFNDAEVLLKAESELFELSPENRIRNFLNQAYIQVNNSYYEEALAIYQQVELIAKEHDDYKALSSCYRNMSLVFGRMGKLEEALGFMKAQAEVLTFKLNDRAAMPGNIEFQGEILTDMGEHDDAIEAYQYLLEDLGDLLNVETYVKAMVAIAKNLVALNQNETALKYLEAAESIMMDNDYYGMMQEVLDRQVDIYKGQNNNEKLITVFEKQLILYRAGENVAKELLTLGNLGIALLFNNQIELAFDRLRELENSAVENQNVGALINALGNQAIAYKHIGDYRRAYEMLQKQENIIFTNNFEPVAFYVDMKKELEVLIKQLEAET